MAGIAALELETKLMKILRENDTVFTKDLTRQLSPFSKTEISQQLYKYLKDGIVDKVSQSPPAWRLKGKKIASAHRHMDCQEISKSPRPEPTLEDIEEQLIQYLKTQDQPLKVGVIASALKINNVKKVTAALFSLKKFNVVKGTREGRGLTWVINWNIVEKDEVPSVSGTSNGEGNAKIEAVEPASTGHSDEESEMPPLEGPSAGQSNTSDVPEDSDMTDTSNADDVMENDSNTCDNESSQVGIKQEVGSSNVLNDNSSSKTDNTYMSGSVASTVIGTIKADPGRILNIQPSPESQETNMFNPATNSNCSNSHFDDDGGSPEQNTAYPERTNIFYPNAIRSDSAGSNAQDEMDVDLSDCTDNDALASQIKDSILACLGKTPNGRLLVKEIFKRVGGQRKKDVNRYLYSMEKSGLVERVQQIPPVWGLTTKGRNAAQGCVQAPPQLLFKQKRAGGDGNQLDERGIPMSPATLIQQQKAWGPGGRSGPLRSPEAQTHGGAVSPVSGPSTSQMLASVSSIAPPKPPMLLDLKTAPSFPPKSPNTSPKLWQGIGRGQVVSLMAGASPSAPGSLGSKISPSASTAPNVPGSFASKTSPGTRYESPTFGSNVSSSLFKSPGTTTVSAPSFSNPVDSIFKSPVGPVNFQAVPAKQGPSAQGGGFSNPFSASKLPQSAKGPPQLPKGPPPSPLELLKSNTVFAAHPTSAKKVNVTGFGPLNVAGNAKSESVGAPHKVNAPGFGPIRVSPVTTPDPGSDKNPFMSSLQRTPLLSNSGQSTFTGSQSSQSTPQESQANVLESGSIPQLDMSALSSDSFAALNKNPVSALMEYAQSRKMTASIELLGQAGPSHNPKFRIAARVGNRLFQEVIARNKKDGRREAADVALRTLISEGQYQVAQASKNNLVERVQKLGLKITFFDKMAAMAHHAFNTLVAMVNDSMSGRKVLAAMVMKRSNEDEGEVISVGTGNRCIEGIYLSLEGKTVNDSHAEVITRRGFIRFVYKNLLNHQPGSAESLFERQPSPRGKLVLKPGISFHLYISTAPCGDGALFSPTDVDNDPMSIDENMEHDPIFTSQIQGVLRTKVERGEGTIPIDPGFKGQTWDGILRGERLRTMSCSDKICRWNILGMQGALLSYFVEPIYLGSLTLGYLYVHGHLSRAVCCRLDNKEPEIVSSLPEGYKVNHPKLGRVTAYDPPRETEKTTSVSMNWIVGDKKPEVTDGTKGCMDSKIQENRVSQVSKLGLYALFKEVCQKYNYSELLKVDSYHAAKLGATDFQAAKSLMNMKFKKSYKSTWVSKPPEEEMFS